MHPCVANWAMWLRKAAGSLHGSVASLAACRKGCSHCCHISVMLSRAEAKVIAKETRGRFNEAAVQITLDDTQERRDALEAITRQTYGQACTFLREGSCSIYSSRPLPCRLLANMDDDDLLCQLVENEAKNVP